MFGPQNHAQAHKLECGIEHCLSNHEDHPDLGTNKMESSLMFNIKHEREETGTKEKWEKSIASS